MENELIAVKLYQDDIRQISEIGFTVFYGIDPINELGVGRSEIPNKWKPLFAYDEDKINHPDFYRRRCEECPCDVFFNKADAEQFVYNQNWFDQWRMACHARYVVGYWTISHGVDNFYIFATKDALIAWVQKFNFNRNFLVRDPDGTKKQIKISVELT